MNPVDRILLVEDDPRLAEMLTEYLGQSGFRVTHAPTGRAAMDHIHSAEIDAVILDLMLPDMDGLDVCRQLRATSDVPVLMLTARGDAIDRIVGLEIGADDYLPKPFEPRELLARLRAILRRRVDVRHLDTARGSAGASASEEFLRFGRLEIDPAAHAARLDGVSCELTAYQFDLLLVLAKHAGRVLSRDALMDLLKGEPLEAFDRSIDVHMSRIRAAVEDDPKKPRRIITVRGAGYLFAKAQD
ncbi:DNA-binding response regulator, OmpR family, contains REC and winged-helix (wHTH) domain [Duganella sacchari]|uniref:DNA-binding response regulator, OmpR family, contains REC and winged-helix (WHTH) domain n=1 Tax=Duganella sacchari TaxID=551987 RepID=A0A1M7HCG0_9BURK|nr:response regulator transcription factor [Duganella sacchari]SHM26130.1 DNA-binding response regulator, OmpR family, contains REC and winged-helix (wHTH) domain [Duganella sacchari]